MKQWTINEIELAKNLNLKGKRFKEIGKLLGRTEKGVKVKLLSLGYKQPNTKPWIKVKCKECGINFEKARDQVKKSKSGNHFCSRSCAATFNNKNKTTGTRRSKLEKWLEDQLKQYYPDLNILFNDKETINSELDIYIPSLNLAFELNGIFHYEPIYGVDKLQQIQENDQSKSKSCHDAKIDLCIIDTSQQKYVKPKTSKKFLEIIIKIINDRKNNIVS